MMHISRFQKLYICLIVLPIAIITIATGCSFAPENYEPTIDVVFEDNDDIFFPTQCFSNVQGSDVACQLAVKKGSQIQTVSYDNYTLSGILYTSENYNYYTLTLHEVFYPSRISITTGPCQTTNYYANSDLITTTQDVRTHINCNTLIYEDCFYQEGFVATGLTPDKIDFASEIISFGSRFDRNNQQTFDLNVVYEKITDTSCFDYETSEKGITITSIDATSIDRLVIPEKIQGQTVISIAANALSDKELSCLVLPPSIKELAPFAFCNCQIDELILFDSLSNICNESFDESQVKKLRINSTALPAYQHRYFAAFADKMDYLKINADNKKILFVAGSSTRYDYDSILFEEAYPDYEVVNMGVYAYTNMTPIMGNILPYINSKDVVLSSPEFDAIDKQFCVSNAFDENTWCMYEANYDLVSDLDISEYDNVWDSFACFLDSRKDLERYDYSDTPAYFDDDGKALEGASYNINGDYTVYRPQNIDRQLFGVKRAYFNKQYFDQSTVAAINTIYEKFEEKGATVLFTYSPRSSESISEDSSLQTAIELDKYLQDALVVPIITDIDYALMDSFYFYGTDNHLSTEGVALHSQKIIEAIRPYMN